MKDPDSNFESPAGMTLRSVSGVNMADEAIRDTLWVRYKIKISDELLLEFVDVLVKSDPTYPSWSERKFKRISESNAREVNDLGVPVTQIFVMNNPERFHQAYLAFMKHRIKE